MTSKRTLAVSAAVVCVLAALGAAAYFAIPKNPPPSPEKPVAAKEETPQVRCVLIRYTGQPRLEFLFDIDRAGEELRYEQRYLIEFTGTDRTMKEPPFPAWRLDDSGEPAKLQSEISVFDNSAAGSHIETLTIELYGYRPEKSDRNWIEAGLKSIHYQNLSGQCQQSRPMPAVSTGS